MRDIELRPLRAVLAVAGLATAGLIGWPATTQPSDAQAAATAASVDRNVYIAGRQVRSPADLRGDFVAAGAKVIVDQPVAGDASLAGASVDVRAPVGDDVRAMGGDVSIESKVGGELFATGGNVTVTRSASVGRGASVHGGSVSIDGRVGGDLKASAQRISIDGEVRGNARLAGERIELGPNARIGGALSYASPAELTKAEGATIAGALTRDDRGAASHGPRADRAWERSARGPWWVGSILAFVSLLALAAMFILLLPGFGDQAARRIEASPWLALGIGFASTLVVPVLAVLLVVTVLGIPLGIALLALYPVLLLAGFVVGVLWIAHLLVRALRKEPPRGYVRTMGYVALALVLVMLVAHVPVAGSIAIALLGVAGVGACVLEMHGRRKGPPPARVLDDRPVAPTPASA